MESRKRSPHAPKTRIKKGGEIRKQLMADLRKIGYMIRMRYASSWVYHCNHCAERLLLRKLKRSPGKIRAHSR